MSSLLPTSRAARGFTLIELLTVIAIIGILAAILIPTVGNVRNKARDVQCIANIREWGRAMTLFAADNNGSYVIWGRLSGRAGDGETTRHWFQVGANNSIYNPYFSSQSNDYGTFSFCPSEPIAKANQVAGGNSPSYTCFLPVLPSLNGALLPDQGIVPYGRVANPSRTMMLVERYFNPTTNQGTTTSIGQYGMAMAGVGTDSSKWTEYRNFNRHGDKKQFNAVFMDGHVKKLAWDNGNDNTSIGRRPPGSPTFNYTNWSKLD
jgi:prepilin-type N-terminal cleavage/methylation domain-containing protein/prepilin-type processing-associated H-X9-DG protein